MSRSTRTRPRTGSVRNPNDFPVQVTAVVVNSRAAISSKECSTTVKFTGTQGDYGPAGKGYKIAVTPKTIGPGGTETITVAELVSQDATASTLCPVKVSYNVIAQVGE